MALPLIFWVCLFLVAYTYALYPAVLFVASSAAPLARRAPTAGRQVERAQRGSAPRPARHPGLLGRGHPLRAGRGDQARPPLRGPPGGCGVRGAAVPGQCRVTADRGPLLALRVAAAADGVAHR